MKPQNLIDNEKGFTLLETLVGFMIAVMILYPLTTMWLDSNQRTGYTLNKTTDIQQSQKVFSELINGSQNKRSGLRHAVRYKISANGIAFETKKITGVQTSEVVAYRLADKKLYKLADLENVDDPLAGGTIVLENVDVFEVEKVSENLIAVSLQTDFGKEKGTDFKTKVLLRGLSSSENNAHGTLPPTSLNALAGNQQITLTWKSNQELTGYKLYRSQTSGDSLAFLTDISKDVTTYQDTGLTNGITYWYALTAMDNENQSGLSTVVSALPIAPADTTPPVSPTGLQSTGKTTSTVTLAWNPNGETDLLGYFIYVKRNNESQYTKANTSYIPKKDTSYTVEGLESKTHYDFVIKAIDTSDNESVRSESITVKTNN